MLGRLTRAAVFDTMHESFVQCARAKGLGERAILFRHVLPNAAIPIVTVLGLQVGYMLGGAMVVEMIFTLPGLGRMTLDAVLGATNRWCRAGGDRRDVHAGESGHRPALRGHRPAGAAAVMWRAIRRARPAGHRGVTVAGLLVVAVLTLIAALAPHVVPGSPTEIARDHALRPPTWDQPFGWTISGGPS